MTELEQSATCYRLRNEFFEFSYQFVADRWQHSVSVRQGNDWRPVLTSLEGQPADSFLSSPAFQDLRFEQPAANIFEFQLLGQSGKGVYSGAVRLDALGRTCDFDLCARGRTAASPLCSCTTYRLAAPDVVPVIRLDRSKAVLIPDGNEPIQIVPVAIPENPVSECRIVDEGSERRLTIGCFGLIRSDVQDKPTSIRWRYQMLHIRHP